MWGVRYKCPHPPGAEEAAGRAPPAVPRLEACALAALYHCLQGRKLGREEQDGAADGTSHAVAGQADVR